MKEKKLIIRFPDSLTFLYPLCILFYALFSRFFVQKGAVPRTLKMQNKAKFKIDEIPVIPSMQRTNKNALRPPQPKNKAKQTQTSLVIPAKAQPRAGIQNKNSHPDLSGFHNFDIYILIFDMFFMTNKPNFKRSQICHKLLYKKGISHVWTLAKREKTNPNEPNILIFKPEMRFIIPSKEILKFPLTQLSFASILPGLSGIREHGKSITSLPGSSYNAEAKNP